MFTLALLALALAATPASGGSSPGDAITPSPPSDCPSCGAYRGPNLERVYDPYLRQGDIWPEFVSATCQFEVASFTFVTLTRSACASERAYRATPSRGADGASARRAAARARLEGASMPRMGN